MTMEGSHGQMGVFSLDFTWQSRRALQALEDVQEPLRGLLPVVVSDLGSKLLITKSNRAVAGSIFGFV